ncbi:acyltransferase family protein [Pseudomonadota bacterium DY0742]|uniref:acyltransferase family protein n=1 Tax=Stutzerimonas balearica TaxID=74829 RepID=UPI001BC9976A|nr:acyltransferase [Stutzerimonas balearica]MBS4149189.1 acyltransferase [Stutzerimonas balearica]
MKERNVWVDYAKAIGIILVVYGHVARGVFNARLPMDEARYTLVDSIIYSFHMPLFFFLSGLFFYDSLVKRGKGGLIINKVDTIVYPFIVWSLLQGFIEVVLSRYTNGQVTVTEVLSLLWMPRAQFWFLYALFLVFVVCAFTYSRADRRYFLPLVVLFGLLFVFQKDIATEGPLRFILGNTVFFALGVWFNEVKAFFMARCAQLSAFFGVLFVVGQYLFHVTYGLNYTVGGLPVLALATVSIFFMAALSMWLGQFRVDWLLFIGASSMTIYLMHILAGSGARVILSKFMGIDSIPLHLVVGTLVGLLAPLAAQWVITRFNLSFLLTPPRPVSATNLHMRKAVAQ